MPKPIEQQAVSKLLKPLRSPCIVDLGARLGEEEGWLRAACKEVAHYVMVEPDPRNCQEILDKGPTHINRRLFIGAVSDSCEMREFHMSWNPKEKSHGSGSLLAPTAHLELIPACQFPFKTMVQCITLDALYKREWLTKIDLLWVDIQGAEMAMIRGGQEALRHTRYLFMEAEKVAMYAGQSTRPELIAALPGWRMVQEFESDVLMANERFSE